jgi:hypothetical protein
MARVGPITRVRTVVPPAAVRKREATSVVPLHAEVTYTGPMPTSYAHAWRRLYAARSTSVTRVDDDPLRIGRAPRS